MTRPISEREYNNLRRVKTLPGGTAYYIMEYWRSGSNHYHWITCLDADLHEIEQVICDYTPAAATWLVRAKNARDDAMLAFDLTPLNDQYYIVRRNADTSNALKTVAAEAARSHGWRV